MLTGTQWGQNLQAKDDFFSSTSQLASTLGNRFGNFTVTSNTVGAYVSVYILYKNVQKTFQLSDNPSAAMADARTYEKIRLSLERLELRATMYGPFALDDKYRRNIGRRTLSLQVLPEDVAICSKNSPQALVPIDPPEIACAEIYYPTDNTQICPLPLISNFSHGCWLCLHW